MLLVQLVLLALALPAMPWVVRALAPGFSEDPERFALAVSLTRITFPYLLFMTLVTLLSGILNAHRRFAVAAGAPVLLNLSMLAAPRPRLPVPERRLRRRLGRRGLGRPAVRAGLVGLPAGRRSPRRSPRRPCAIRRMRRLLRGARAGGDRRRPASRSPSFADTIIASFLPTGRGLGALLRRPALPAPLRRHRHRGRHGAPARDEPADRRWRRRRGACGAEPGGGVLARPVGALHGGLPDPAGPDHGGPVPARRLRRPEDAARAASVLAAYGLALPAVVLVRSAVASFYARQDTMTPLCASLTAIAINVALKVVLTGPYGVTGLALATAIGQWVNLALLVVLARRRGWTAPGRTLGLTVLGGRGRLPRRSPRWPSTACRSSEALVPALPHGRELAVLASARASPERSSTAACCWPLRLFGLRLRRPEESGRARSPRSRPQDRATSRRGRHDRCTRTARGREGRRVRRLRHPVRRPRRGRAPRRGGRAGCGPPLRGLAHQAARIQLGPRPDGRITRPSGT